MTGVQTLTVAPDEADLRLDRWFRRHFPALAHGRLEKLLRTGQVRLDGGRAKAADRIAAGQEIRVPPLGELPARDGKPVPKVRDADLRDLQGRVLHMDASVLVIDKPPGLATQGGSKLERHLDGMLGALQFEAKERPRLVHRLDKDTSGVLVLGRTAKATAKLAEAFRHKSARKIYWALVAGVPKLRRGRIELALAKTEGPGGERMMEDQAEGKRAVTWYATLDTAGRRAAWLALMPETGRTHQLRAHCAYLETPIVGDAKYGGEAA